MANYPSFLLTGKRPAATYENVVQYVAASSSLVDGLGNEFFYLKITASNAVSASWAPFTDDPNALSASWASQSLSASWAPFTDSPTASYLTPANDYAIHNLSASNNISASSLILTSPYSTALQVGTSLPIYLSPGWPTVGFNSYWDSAYKFGPGSSNKWAAFEDLNVDIGQIEFYFPSAVGNAGASWTSPTQVFAISYDGMVKMPLLPYGILTISGSSSVTSSTDLTHFNSSVSYAISASWAPSTITYPLGTLPVNQVSYSINFSAGQYFQLDTTASEFTFGNSSNVVAVRNASVYISPQAGVRTIVFHPSWTVLGNFPTTIAENSASILSLTTFGSNDSTIVVAFASKV